MWWIAGGQIWLFICSVSVWGLSHISASSPFLCRTVFSLAFFLGLFLFFYFLSCFPWGGGGGARVFQALPLFTCFFVLGCHIISLSDAAASLRARNEEVEVAQPCSPALRASPYVRARRCPGVCTYLAVDRFVFFHSCLYHNCLHMLKKKGGDVCVLLLQENQDHWIFRHLTKAKSSYCVLLRVFFFNRCQLSISCFTR